MKLLTKEIRQLLPGLHATEREADPVVQVKFFSVWSNWTWYVTEFDGDDTLFGLVDGFEREWGYFNLSELVSIRGPLGTKAVERDMNFRPTPVSKLEKRGRNSSNR